MFVVKNKLIKVEVKHVFFFNLDNLMDLGKNHIKRRYIFGLAQISLKKAIIIIVINLLLVTSKTTKH